MKKLADIIKEHQHQKAMSKLHKWCVLGIADKKVSGCEDISFQTWVELLGVYQMLVYGQQMPPMSRAAQSVISKVGL